MEIESVIGRPIPLPLDVSLLSGRVINSLCRVDKFSKEDRTVFNKAADFLEEVQRGGNAVNRLELSATTGRDIESFSLAANAYKILGKKRNVKEHALRIKEINRLFNIAKQLAENEPLPVTDIQDLRDFFESAKAITKNHTAGEIDRVNLG